MNNTPFNTAILSQEPASFPQSLAFSYSLCHHNESSSPSFGLIGPLTHATGRLNRLLFVLPFFLFFSSLSTSFFFLLFILLQWSSSIVFLSRVFLSSFCFFLLQLFDAFSIFFSRSLVTWIPKSTSIMSLGSITEPHFSILYSINLRFFMWNDIS